MLSKIAYFFVLISFSLLVDDAWAWGPAMHTAIACRILQNGIAILPAIASIIKSFPREFVYGSLAADFFVGKGTKPKEGHSHNWQTAFRLLHKAKGEQEAAYSYGFLSHLAADVIAHNYFVPNLIHQVSTWRKAGHIYWEAKADHSVGPVYMKIAKELLVENELGCDDLLKAAVGKKRNGLKARRQIFTQTVKISDYLTSSVPVSLIDMSTRYRIAPAYLAFMVNLSYELVRDVLMRPYSSPCLSFDPIGSLNLRLAGQFAVLSRLFDFHRPHREFIVAKELLEIMETP